MSYLSPVRWRNRAGLRRHLTLSSGTAIKTPRDSTPSSGRRTNYSLQTEKKLTELLFPLGKIIGLLRPEIDGIIQLVISSQHLPHNSFSQRVPDTPAISRSKQEHVQSNRIFFISRDHESSLNACTYTTLHVSTSTYSRSTDHHELGCINVKLHGHVTAFD